MCAERQTPMITGTPLRELYSEWEFVLLSHKVRQPQDTTDLERMADDICQRFRKYCSDIHEEQDTIRKLSEITNTPRSHVQYLTEDQFSALEIVRDDLVNANTLREKLSAIDALVIFRLPMVNIPEQCWISIRDMAAVEQIRSRMTNMSEWLSDTDK